MLDLLNPDHAQAAYFGNSASLELPREACELVACEGKKKKKCCKKFKKGKKPCKSCPKH